MNGINQIILITINYIVKIMNIDIERPPVYWILRSIQRRDTLKDLKGDIDRLSKNIDKKTIKLLVSEIITFDRLDIFKYLISKHASIYMVTVTVVTILFSGNVDFMKYILTDKNINKCAVIKLDGNNNKIVKYYIRKGYPYDVIEFLLSDEIIDKYNVSYLMEYDRVPLVNNDNLKLLRLLLSDRLREKLDITFDDVLSYFIRALAIGVDCSDSIGFVIETLLKYDNNYGVIQEAIIVNSNKISSDTLKYILNHHYSELKLTHDVIRLCFNTIKYDNINTNKNNMAILLEYAERFAIDI